MSSPHSAGPTIDEISPYYGYVPSLAAVAVITAMFSVSTIFHFGQAIHYKIWYMLFTAVACGLFEVTGWASRLYSHFHPDKLAPYLVQTVSTINAPTPLIAAYFVILAEIIRRLGPCYSRLKPKLYTIVFVTADLVALTVQAVGGTLASIAAANEKNPEKGGRIMLGGIVFQLFAITIYMALGIEFVYRFWRNKPFQGRDDIPASDRCMDRGTKLMLLGTTFSSLAIYVRSVYRTIELVDGWDGRIIKNELYFNIMDGAMIVVAMFCLNGLHPGRLLKPDSAPVKEIASISSSSGSVEKPKEPA